MDGLRKCIKVDNHEAVKVQGLRRDVKSFMVVKPKLTPDFPGAVLREGADELTLRTHGRRCTAHFHGHFECGRPKMVASAGRCGLSCLLPGYLPGN